MSQIAVNGCLCRCIYGSLPGTLLATNQSKVLVEGKPVCVLNDVNFQIMPPFGICTSPVPPTPVPIPAPCTCVIPPVWITSNPTILADNKPVLEVGSMTMCATRAGMISIVSSGQGKAV